jgi:hypothetical protein
MRYTKKQNLSVRKIDVNTFILNRDDSMMHALNPTASLIWNCMDSNLDPSDIAKKITDDFDVSLETAITDMHAFISQCESKKLISFDE